MTSPSDPREAGSGDENQFPDSVICEACEERVPIGETTTVGEDGYYLCAACYKEAKDG